MGGGVVSIRLTVRGHVDESRDRKAEMMVESVFDLVGGVVTRLDRDVGFDGYRGSNTELMTVPPDPQVSDILDARNRTDGCLDLIDYLRFDTVEYTT
jgi:hypothetical protein